MGKIKSKAIKSAAKILVDKGIEFTENFDRNKKILKNTLSSKKQRNQMAGFLVRLKKQEKQEQAKLQQALN